MAFSSNCGLNINLFLLEGQKLLNYLFVEECGVVIEISNEYLSSSLSILKAQDLEPQVISETNFKNNFIDITLNNQQLIKVVFNDKNIFHFCVRLPFKI